jgi:serine/threonine protein kinase
MGEVFLAQHDKIGTKVAVKMLLPHISANTEHVQRFFNEAIAASKITHSGIGKIFDVGFTQAGRAYLVMEFLSGETLAKRIERLGRVPLRQLAEIGKQIASVLDAVHKAGITHRDLKPDNIFIVPDSELESGERVKVLDFGIAKLGDHGGATMTGAGWMGTAEYMAPEQWKSAKNVDWRADAYSLGCVAFEMATGRRPFIAESVGEYCTKHLLEPPPRVSSVAPQAASLDALVDRLLAKEPAQRPASMKEIGAAFAAAASMADRSGYAETIAPSASGSAHAPVPPTLPPTYAPVISTPRPVAVATPTPPPPPNQPAAGTTTQDSAGERVSLTRSSSSARRLIVLLGGALVALAAVVVVIVMKLSDGTKTSTLASEPSTSDASVDAAASLVVTPLPTADAAAPAPVAMVDAALSVDAARVAAATPSSGAVAPQAGSDYGTLRIESKPSCLIVVDSYSTDLRTPQRAMRLPVGTRSIGLINEEWGIREYFSVEIKAGETTKVSNDYSKLMETIANPPPPPPPAPSAGCDEVSCVLNNYEGECCTKFKKKSAERSSAPSASTRNADDLPEFLDRAMISDGVAKVKARVTACGDKSSAKGQVKVKVQVGPDGRVTNTSIATAPDPALASCVQAAMAKATFKRTQNGGSFTFPFVF